MKNPRNYFIDNIKGVLIFLVVFGHLIEMFINDNEYMKTIYLSIYSFHMPLFVLISGMYSYALFSINSLKKNIRSLLLPFIAFESVYELSVFIVTGSVSHYLSQIAPYWILWFLLSVFVWKLLLPIFHKFRFPIVISFIIALSLPAIESVGYTLSISRIFTFFPFFLIGFYYKDSLLSLLQKERFRSYYYPLSLLFVGICFLCNAFIPPEFLYGSHSYASLNLSFLSGVLLKMLFYTTACFVGFTVMAIIPQKKSFFSHIGQKSLYIYLLHGFVILLLSRLEFIQILFSYNPFLFVLFALCVTAVLVFLFSRNFIVSLYSFFLITAVGYIFKNIEKFYFSCIHFLYRIAIYINKNIIKKIMYIIKASSVNIEK